jgi:hypothetical protein
MPSNYELMTYETKKKKKKKLKTLLLPGGREG